MGAKNDLLHAALIKDLRTRANFRHARPHSLFGISPVT